MLCVDPAVMPDPRLVEDVRAWADRLSLSVAVYAVNGSAYDFEEVLAQSAALQRVATDVSGPGRRVDVIRTDSGGVARNIIEFADATPGTLVALGTHARPIASRLFLGSVAMAVCRRTHSPLLLRQVQSPERRVPPDSAVTCTLPDGRRVTLRALRSDDAAALVDAFAHADPSDLRRRFMGVPPAVSYLVQQLRRMDGVHDVALGAFDDDARLVAVAQFDRLDNRPRAEVAIEVDKDWQHDGLGVALLSALAGRARELGINTFTATYYADNVAIRRLLGDIGHIVSSGYASGEGYAVLDITTAPRRTMCE